MYSELQPTEEIPVRDLYATPRHSVPQMRFYMKSQHAHGRRDRVVLAVCPESRNKPLHTREREPSFELPDTTAMIWEDLHDTLESGPLLSTSFLVRNRDKRT